MATAFEGFENASPVKSTHKFPQSVKTLSPPVCPAPATAGANWTEIVQLCDFGSVPPHRVSNTKGPVIVIRRIVNTGTLTLATDTACTTLRVLPNCIAKGSRCGS